MPIARHFTKRLRSDSSGMSTPTRTFSTRNGKHMGVDKISLPVTLLSTTNTMSYDAPDVVEAQMTWKTGNPDGVVIPGVTDRKYPFYNQAESTTPALSPDSSARTSSEDEHSKQSTVLSSPSSPSSVKTPTLTDGSSVGSTPAVELNHLSCYFPDPGPAAVKRTPSQRLSNKASASPVQQQHPAPAVPKRAPSHSKREHVKLARQRSLRSASRSGADSPTLGLENTMSTPPSPTTSTSPSHSGEDAQRSSSDASVAHSAPVSAKTSLDNSAIPAQNDAITQHPFAGELEKLDEVAEGFHGVVQSLQDQEDEYMVRRGLGRFTALDYTDMIGAGPRFSLVLESSHEQQDSWVGWI